VVEMADVSVAMTMSLRNAASVREKTSKPVESVPKWKAPPGGRLGEPATSIGLSGTIHGPMMATMKTATTG